MWDFGKWEVFTWSKALIGASYFLVGKTTLVKWIVKIPRNIIAVAEDISLRDVASLRERNIYLPSSKKGIQAWR